MKGINGIWRYNDVIIFISITESKYCFIPSNLYVIVINYLKQRLYLGEGRTAERKRDGEKRKEREGIMNLMQQCFAA